MQKLAFYQNNDKTIENWQEFLEVWSNIFDGEFADKFRSEDTQVIQGKLLNLAMNYWLEQQQLIEGFSKSLELPSCNQVDENRPSISF